MPDLSRMKIKYFGDKETIGEKQAALYKENHYHPLLSLIPLAIQILILFGLVEVIRDIAESGTPGTEFLGMVPMTDGGISWVMPILAGISAFIMGEAQNRIHPLQKEQSKLEKNTTNWLSIALSLFLGVMVSAGMAFYWICSNLLSIAVQALCNVIIKPAKSIDYADLKETSEELEKLNQLSKTDASFRERRRLATRECEDIERFNDVLNKHVVFFSEGSGFYKYFKGAIEWLLENSTIRIHYLTEDPNDQVFELHKDNPRLIPYYVSEKRLITVLMKLECMVCVMTQEDLDNFYMKRSYIDSDIEYIFIPHHMTSVFLTATEDAFKNYDTVLCVGPHQRDELKHLDHMPNGHTQKLVECGSALLDTQIAEYRTRPKAENKKPTVLIAPSWQDDCILDICIDQMLDSLIGHGYRVIVRPHPEYTKRYKARWEALQEKYADISESELYFEHDFSTSDAIFDSDVIITDWSSVNCEFSFATLRPGIFVDTPMKVHNPNWQNFGMDPTDITLRNQIGTSLAPDEMDKLPSIIDSMIENSAEWKKRIQDIRDGFIFNLGCGKDRAGEYILDAVLRKQSKLAESSENDKQRDSDKNVA